MKLSVILLCALVAVQAALLAAPSAEASGLKVGYYNRKCKGVEAVVKGHIIRAMKKNPRVGAALVRLVFHDCFVRAQAELPDSTFTAQQLIDNFARKNFDVEELVILSGAHSIGMAHCSSFKGRLTAPADQITPAYRNLLNDKCGQRSNPLVVNNVRDEDYSTVSKYMPGFKSRVRKIRDLFDNSYYHNNLARIVSFNSDWVLMTHKEARGHVHEYADNATLWNDDFGESMIKLSQLSMPAGSKGGIRKKCSIVSHPLH